MVLLRPPSPPRTPSYIGFYKVTTSRAREQNSWHASSEMHEAAAAALLGSSSEAMLPIVEPRLGEAVALEDALGLVRSSSASLIPPPHTKPRTSGHVFYHDKRNSAVRDQMLVGLFDTPMPKKSLPVYIPPSRQRRVSEDLRRQRLASAATPDRPSSLPPLQLQPPEPPADVGEGSAAVADGSTAPATADGPAAAAPGQAAPWSGSGALPTDDEEEQLLPPSRSTSPSCSAGRPAPVVPQKRLSRRLELERQQKAKDEAERLSRMRSRWVDAHARMLEGGVLTRRGAKASLLQVAREAIQNAHTMAALRELPVFRGLGETKLSMLATGGVFRTVPRYTAIYRQEAEARSFFILAQGSVCLSREKDTHAELPAMLSIKPGAVGRCFGLESLSSMRRQTTATALDDCTLIVFSMANISVGEGGAAAIAHKVFEHFLDSELAAMSLFQGIPATTLRAITHLFELEEYPVSAPIFAEGASGDAFFILLHGQVRVSKDGLTLAVLQAGQETVSKQERNPFFGEMALLDNKPRMASVVTASPSKLLKLTKAKFAKFLQEVPDFAKRLKRIKDIRMAQSKINIRNRTEGVPTMRAAMKLVAVKSIGGGLVAGGDGADGDGDGAQGAGGAVLTSGKIMTSVTSIQSAMRRERRLRSTRARARARARRLRSPPPHSREPRSHPTSPQDSPPRGWPRVRCPSRHPPRRRSRAHLTCFSNVALAGRRASSLEQQRRSEVHVGDDGRRDTLTADFNLPGFDDELADQTPGSRRVSAADGASAERKSSAASRKASGAGGGAPPQSLGLVRMSSRTRRQMVAPTVPAPPHAQCRLPTPLPSHAAAGHLFARLRCLLCSAQVASEETISEAIEEEGETAAAATTAAATSPVVVLSEALPDYPFAEAAEARRASSGGRSDRQGLPPPPTVKPGTPASHSESGKLIAPKAEPRLIGGFVGGAGWGGGGEGSPPRRCGSPLSGLRRCSSPNTGQRRSSSPGLGSHPGSRASSRRSNSPGLNRAAAALSSGQARAELELAVARLRRAEEAREAAKRAAEEAEEAAAAADARATAAQAAAEATAVGKAIRERAEADASAALIKAEIEERRAAARAIAAAKAKAKAEAEAQGGGGGGGEMAASQGQPVIHSV